MAKKKPTREATFRDEIVNQFTGRFQRGEFVLMLRDVFQDHIDLPLYLSCDEKRGEIEREFNKWYYKLEAIVRESDLDEEREKEARQALDELLSAHHSLYCHQLEVLFDTLVGFFLPLAFPQLYQFFGARKGGAPQAVPELNLVPMMFGEGGES